MCKSEFILVNNRDPRFKVHNTNSLTLLKQGISHSLLIVMMDEPSRPIKLIESRLIYDLRSLFKIRARDWSKSITCE